MAFAVTDTQLKSKVQRGKEQRAIDGVVLHAYNAGQNFGDVVRQADAEALVRKLRRGARFHNKYINIEVNPVDEVEEETDTETGAVTEHPMSEIVFFVRDKRRKRRESRAAEPPAPDADTDSGSSVTGDVSPAA